jgi:hypothetical protein
MEFPVSNYNLNITMTQVITKQAKKPIEKRLALFINIKVSYDLSTIKMKIKLMEIIF